MLGGGRVAGYAVDDARGECAEDAARDRLVNRRRQLVLERAPLDGGGERFDPALGPDPRIP